MRPEIGSDGDGVLPNAARLGDRIRQETPWCSPVREYGPVVVLAGLGVR